MRQQMYKPNVIYSKQMPVAVIRVTCGLSVAFKPKIAECLVNPCCAPHEIGKIPGNNFYKLLKA
jgi:hypothetical protein